MLIPSKMICPKIIKNSKIKKATSDALTAMRFLYFFPNCFVASKYTGTEPKGSITAIRKNNLVISSASIVFVNLLILFDFSL